MTDEDWRSGVLNRLTAVEARLIAVETKNAVDEVHRQNVEKRLTAIESGISKLFWLIGGVVAVAIITFILEGGLAP